MPLDIGESINCLADVFLKAPMIHTIASNPVYTAMMITFIVMMIVLIVFRDAKTEDGLLIMTLRIGFWILLANITIIFIHNKLLTIDNTTVEITAAYDGIFNNVSGSAAEYDLNILDGATLKK